MDVKFIFDRWQHHSAHSGYDIMVPQLGSHLPSLSYEDRKARLVPWRLANFFVLDKAGMRHYSHHQFYYELTAALDMRRSRNTIYHIMEGDFGYRHLGRLNGVKGNRVVATYHLPPSRLADDIWAFTHLKRLSAIFVVAKNQIPFFTAHVSQEKVHWVPIGVDTQFFRPAPRQVPTDTRQCVFVGRHMRDLETLKRVVQLLATSGLNVRTVIVTDKVGQQMFAGLPGVETRVGIPEQELLALYQQSDLLLLPLFDATAVIALLESLACGLPAVVSNVGGIPDYVDSSCAILVPPRDPEAMYTAVYQALLDDNRRQELSRQARQRSLQFDWSEIVCTMRTIYGRLGSGMDWKKVQTAATNSVAD